MLPRWARNAPKSAVSAFDAAYAAYADFQSNMERYWCLRWLAQENAQRVEAVVLKEEVLRLVDIPLIIRLPGMPATARGSQVKLDLVRWDEVDLTVEARLVEVIQAQPDAGLAEEMLEDEVADEPSPEAIVEQQVEGGMNNSVAATTDSAQQLS